MSFILTQMATKVRKIAANDYGDGQEAPLAATPRGELIVANGFPDRSELVRQGNSWTARVATASAFTHVAALPTTRAELMLYNGETTTGKSYLIDSVFYMALTSITAAANASLIVQVVPSATMVAPTHSATTSIISSLSGKSAYAGNAKRAVAVTTCFTDLWTVVATGASPATATIGFGLNAEVYGKFIIPPGAGFGVNVVVGTATGTAIVGVTWHEVQLYGY